MLHGENAYLLLILGYFIIVIVFLGIFWRIAIALDHIARNLHDLSKDLGKISAILKDKHDKE